MALPKVKVIKTTIKDNAREVPHREITSQYLGIVWDEYTPKVESAILRDILALRAMYGAGLVAVFKGNEPKALLKTLGVRCEANVNSASIWKAYIVKSTPDIPDSAEHAYYTNVGEKVSEPRMTRDDPRYPVLDRPGDFRMVPSQQQLTNFPRAPRHSGGTDRSVFWNGIPFL